MSVEVDVDGGLEVRTYERSQTTCRLLYCPFCGYEFDENERRYLHLAEHNPEDAGLSPLGTIPDDHDAPLFGGVRR